MRAFFHEGLVQHGIAPNTFVTCKQTLDVFFPWCVAHQALARNPATGVETPRVPKLLPARLNCQKAQRLLDVTENHPWPTGFFNTATTPSWRRSSLWACGEANCCTCSWVDADLESQVIVVRGFLQSGREEGR